MPPQERQSKRHDEDPRRFADILQRSIREGIASIRFQLEMQEQVVRREETVEKDGQKQ